MHVIEARNVNSAYRLGLLHLMSFGVLRSSRAGDVIEAPTPVTSVYLCPTERVLFHRGRDANPFFHLMEGIWMLAGRRDVAFVSEFNSRIHQYSDDGREFHGAYGHRWRHYFHFDQLIAAARTLATDRDTRRVVVTMWDVQDLLKQSKDIPCNTHIYFKPKPNGTLDMTVCNRSNDIIWGAYGANAVHMSMLHEWMAAASNLQVGVYRQMSDSYHAYVEIFDKLAQQPREMDRYYRIHEPRPNMVDLDPVEWLDEAERFCRMGPGDRYDSYWLQNVAVPMWRAWHGYKTRDFRQARLAASTIASWDWRQACLEWLERREK